MTTPVSEQYSELLHYTTSGGLSGILSSGSLWATDARFLNDSSEIEHFFEQRLRSILVDEANRYALELAREPWRLARIISEGGFEKLVGNEADVWHSALRRVTLAMNRPFVLSFSAPADDRVRQSGLLSQWRGYGVDGGYALVFDTQKLEAMLLAEANAHQYIQVLIGDVHYHGVDSRLQASSPDVAEFEEIVHQGVARLIRGGTALETERFYEAIISLSCLCKHWGFWEEREVRVVAVLSSNSDAQASEPRSSAEKEIKEFDRKQEKIPYIDLFSSLSATDGAVRLPIKRVIVGPHKNRVQHAEFVRRLLDRGGYLAEVVQSEIPYIG